MIGYISAVDDPDTPFSHVAVRWNEELLGWEFLCAGRTAEEFQQRLTYWTGKGISESSIRKYVCQQVVSVAVTQAEPQPVEGESWGEWVGRLRAAQNRITTENRPDPPQPPAQQPVPISDELWNVIRERRPNAYETLQRHGVRKVIMTVGTARTKLEFPTCTYMSPVITGWTAFDRDAMNPDRPIIVLDGTPENGFKPISWRHWLPGTK